MANVYLDRTDDGNFSVRVMTGAYGDKTKTFATHADAEAFAIAKMGKRHGMILDTTSLTPEQLAAHREKQERIRKLAAEMYTSMAGAP